jgi:DNA topoisomerase I
VPDNTLVIVESPAKAKKIAGYLGDGYTVLASVGHIRDLASKASEIPAEDRKKPWAKLAVNVDDAFQPFYVIHDSKKATIKELKAALKNADELLLATDEDREGEAISWHLLEVLNPKVPVKRMVFNEITPEAIREAVHNPRELDMRLVDAQETRRVVDRLYGYPVSEVLWKKIGREAKSAGRVQSVAVRLVVDKERERIAFTAQRSTGASTPTSSPDRSPGVSALSMARRSLPVRTSTNPVACPAKVPCNSTSRLRTHWWLRSTARTSWLRRWCKSRRPRSRKLLS